MARSQLKGKSYGSTRKVAAARAAVNRASSILRARGTSYMAPSSSRGFYGNYKSNGRRGFPELKFIDNFANGNPVTNTGTTVLINGVGQGTDYNQRIGRHAIMKSILLNWNVYLDSSQAAGLTGEGIWGRIMIVYDGQPNSGSLASVTDILQVDDVNSPMNLNNRDRFKVIYDKRVGIAGATYTSGTLTTGNPEDKGGSKYKKCKLDMVFSGTGATIGSISTGSLILLFICDVSALALNYYTRVRFIDN